MGTNLKIRKLTTSKGSTKLGPAASIVLGVAAWALLILAGLFSMLLLGWILLGIILLGNGPSTNGVPVPEILIGLLALTGCLAWLTTRYFASWRRVGLIIGLILVLTSIVELTWALSAPNQALYFAREMVWGENDIHSYQKYPQRVVSNAPPVFTFPQNPSPQLFQKIRYQQAGQMKQTSLVEFLAATKTTSFIVIKDGAILDESYANGYTRDSVVTSFSISKSFTSALIGIAINEGYIGGVDDRVISYLPELSGRGLDKMTIRDLLSMSAGISYAHQDEQPPLVSMLGLNDDTRVTYFPNLRSLALSVRAGNDAPGTAFNYNDDVPMLLGMILERTTHRPVAQYLQEKIWQPLGMEYPASWSLDNSQSGFEKMAMGINARAIDLAKFGELYLDNGNWNGKQIIPAAWVNESTTPDLTDNRIWRRAIQWKNANGYYKYLWWGQTRPDGSYVFMARGNLQQQWIYVSPSDHVVIVRFGLVDGSADWWPNVFQNVIDSINNH